MRKIVNLSAVFIATLYLLIILVAITSTQVASLEPQSSSSSSGSSSNLDSNSNPSQPSSSQKSFQSSTTTTTATQARQSTAASATSLIGAIGSLIPGFITNVAPLVMGLLPLALALPYLSAAATSLLREARRSSNDQSLPNIALPSAFSQYARPLQTSPQDIYYFTKRSFPSLMSGINTQGLVRGMQDLLERVAKAIDNADKRYN